MKNSRIYIRIDSSLAKKIKGYAKRKRSTVTQLVLDHFQYLLSVEAVKDGIMQAAQAMESSNGVHRADRAH